MYTNISSEIPIIDFTNKITSRLFNISEKDLNKKWNLFILDLRRHLNVIGIEIPDGSEPNDELQLMQLITIQGIVEYLTPKFCYDKNAFSWMVAIYKTGKCNCTCNASLLVCIGVVFGWTNIAIVLSKEHANIILEYGTHEVMVEITADTPYFHTYKYLELHEKKYIILHKPEEFYEWYAFISFMSEKFTIKETYNRLKPIVKEMEQKYGKTNEFNFLNSEYTFETIMLFLDSWIRSLDKSPGFIENPKSIGLWGYSNTGFIPTL
jgi:hypothetical protein